MKDVISEMRCMTYDRALQLTQQGKLEQPEMERIERARTHLKNDCTFISFALNVMTCGRKQSWRGHGKSSARRRIEQNI